MTSQIRTGQRRAIAVLAAIAVIVTVLGLAFSTVDAGSSVTPQSGPAGKVVRGTHNGTPKKLQTMLFQVDLNGQASFMFCIDIATNIQFGVSYDEAGWDRSSVPNLSNIARILAQTDATITKDPVEIAAAQAAIWHFSDGFDLDVANPQNDPAVTSRYNVLVSDASANPVSDEPAGTLAISPATATVAQGQPAFFDVASTAKAPLGIELSDAAVTAHPAAGDVCDTATTITTATAGSRICLTSAEPRTNVRMTLRTGSAPVSAGRVFIRPQRQKLIIGKAGAAQSAESVTVNWTADGRPSVTIACPANGVTVGVAAEYRAASTDPENGPLTYAWSVNGIVVDGQTTDRVTLTPAAGDRVSVTVRDASGQSATAEATCPGRNAPTVTLVCPESLQLGVDNTFTAQGSDPEGDTLTYTWTINGASASETGASFTTTVNAGDVLAVRATDSSALSSATVEAGCIPAAENHPPTVALVCPEGLVFGTPTAFTATGTDPDGDTLTYVWSVNGTPIDGAVGATATLTVDRGDTVAVTTSDGSLTSAAATATCTGATPNRPPTVTLDCPTRLVWGSAATFTATGTDPDGDRLTYAWAVNGTAVPGASGATVAITLRKGDVVTVTATDPGGAASTTVTGNCRGNSRPDVELTCPATVVYGEPTEFAAAGTDADGDPLTYAWRVNGVVDVLQTMATASLVVSPGDRVNVAAIDDHGEASASMTVQCRGIWRPTVTITCPARLVWGEPFDFIANGVDPDGDTELAYTWYINGAPVADESGPRLTTTLGFGDILTVTVTNRSGAVSAEAGADCSGNGRPEVALVCPENLVFGSPATFTATAVDPDGDELAYEWKVNDGVVDDATGSTIELTISRGDRVTVSVGDGALNSASATSTCTGSSKPAVTTVCPPRVVLGEPAAFGAIGTDEDGDSLTYEWRVNGAVVPDVTGPLAALTLQQGDVVSVTAADPTGLTSASATFDCVSVSRPKISILCPADQVFGQPTVLKTATEGSDAGELAFTWAVNGRVIAGQAGPTIRLTLQAGDQVAVTAIAANGLVAVTVGTLCHGTVPTDIPPVPAMPQVLSSTVYTAATQAAAATSVESLPITGSQTFVLIGIALAALAVGLLLVRFGGRRRANPSPSEP